MVAQMADGWLPHQVLATQYPSTAFIISFGMEKSLH